MAEQKIPLSDLPQGVPGAYDKVAGVDTATGASRLFPLPQPGVPRSYATRAQLPAASGFTEGYTVWVNNDPTPANNGTWSVQSGAWVQSADRVTGLEGRASTLERNMVALVPDKNLLDKSKIRRGKQVSPGSSAIITSSAYRCSDFIPVVPGRSYRASGLDAGMSGGWFSSAADNAYIAAVPNTIQAAPSTAPDGANFLVLNITNDGQDVVTFDHTAQVEEGTAATAYEPFRLVVPAPSVKGLEAALADTLRESDILVPYSFNRIDPAAADYVRRYTTSTRTFITDSIGIAASARIPVIEGEWYTVSGDALYTGPTGDPLTAQGGYFVGNATTAVQNITFVAPVTGGGAAFQVPTGMGITDVVVSLWKAGRIAASTSLDGNVQLELGEMATAYRPYSASMKVNPDLLLEGGAVPQPAGGFDAAAWYRFTDGDSGESLADMIPNFRKHWLLRDRDLCVVNTGTSLTARTVEHCTDHPQAALRPPLMHSRNMASILWDKMRWDGQQYRRYDVPGFFAETGTFTTSTNLAEWDDGAYRHGLTRYATGPASVQFEVPEGAWQFNFIYRTDSLGSEACTLTVAGGSGLMQVQNTAGAWVEANGYTFSMREAAPAARSIVVPNPTTGGSSTVSIPSKGNTTYQRRLKMRCKGGAVDSRALSKTVTIAASAGHFMYWGVEWSLREFMLTYINAARGSHNTQATSTTGLPRFQDNEVWSFKPDLLFFELPIHNDGAAGAGVYPVEFWGRLTDNFVFRADYELSLRARAAHFGLSPEMGMFTSSVAWNFGGINDDGSLKLVEQTGGRMMTALDKFSAAAQWVRENHPDVPCIHAAKRWCDAAMAIFGDLRSATVGSGKGGATFTNEGSHWNDTGSKIIAKALTPVFEFLR